MINRIIIFKDKKHLHLLKKIMSEDDMRVVKKAIVNIRNCMFGINCDASWDDMKIVDHNDDTNSEIRFCNYCQREVHECNDNDELAKNIRLNRCVRFYDHEYSIHPIMGEYTIEGVE